MFPDYFISMQFSLSINIIYFPLNFPFINFKLHFHHMAVNSTFSL